MLTNINHQESVDHICIYSYIICMIHLCIHKIIYEIFNLVNFSRRKYLIDNK